MRASKSIVVAPTTTSSTVNADKAARRARGRRAIVAGEAVVARARTIRCAVPVVAAVAGADARAAVITIVAHLAVAHAALALAALIASARTGGLGAIIPTVAQRAEAYPAEAIAVRRDARR